MASRLRIESADVIPRPAILVLTTILVVLTFATAMIASLHTLLAALGDLAAAGIARWIAIGCMGFLGIDTLLLVAALGWNASRPAEPPSQDG